MTSISLDNSKKLFSVPKVAWEEARVDNSDTVVTPLDTIITTKTPIDITKERISLLVPGYKILQNEYQMMIDILKKRADYRKISMSIGIMALSDQSLSSAMNVLYGRQMDVFTFDNYVDLLIHENKTVSDFVGSNIDSVMTIDDAKNIYKSSMTDTISHSINVLKSSFKNYITSIDARDLLQADKIVSESVSAGTAIANIQTIAPPDDIQPISGVSTDKSPAPAVFAANVKKLLDQCIPCNARSLGTLEDYRTGPFLNLFWQNIVKDFLAKVKTLMLMKLNITGTYFTPDACAIVNSLTDFVCLPDLKALIALFNMMLFKFKKIFDVDISGVSLSTSVGAELTNTLVGSALSVLMTFLTQLSETILSPIECVITALEVQLNKYSTNDYLSGVNSTLQSGYQDYYHYALLGKEYVTSLIQETSNEINKTLRWNVFKSEDMFDLYQNIDRVQNHINLLLEIFRMFDQLRSLKLTDSDAAQKLGQAICKTAIGQQNPWIKVIDDLTNPGTSNTPPPVVVVHPPPIGDPVLPLETPVKVTSIGGVLITDPTVPPGFFDDPWINVAQDPITKEILNSIEFNNVENGDDPLNFDYTKIDDYIAATHVSRTYPPQTVTDQNNNPLIALPVAYLDFDACIKANNLSDYSEQQIQQWINQVK